MSSAAGVLITYLAIIALPNVVTTVVSMDKYASAKVFSWAMASLTAVSVELAVSQYLGERLALDWRRALTRRVRSVCAGLSKLHSGPTECNRAGCHCVSVPRAVLQWEGVVLAEPS